MRFVLQSNEVLYDFQRVVVESQRYYAWRDPDREFTIIWDKDITDLHNKKEYCPVGSIEFCLSWYKEVWGKEINPRNVPLELANRIILETPADLSIFKGSIFIKSMTDFKASENGPWEKDQMWRFEDKKYQVSGKLDIRAEYRCFIWKGLVCDIKQYSGDPFARKPSEEYIESLLQDFQNPPIAYTIDIGILGNGGETVIEVHDFFSCGLYGFDDLYKVPGMLWSWFLEFTKK